MVLVIEVTIGENDDVVGLDVALATPTNGLQLVSALIRQIQLPIAVAK